MSTSDSEKQKPRAKRYSYDCDAQCYVDEQILEIKLLNISVSGIQFAAPRKIETQMPVRLQWTDLKFGEFLLSLVIKREVCKPENKEFQYYYGSQYYSLDEATKQSLVNLLKNCSQEEKNAVRQQIEKITPMYLFQSIDGGREFLGRLLKSNQGVPHFDKILNQIVDYEKAAFTSSDEISLYIQKLTTHHFHCNLLCMLGPIVAEHTEWKLPHFLRVNAELQKISETENEGDSIVKKMLDQPAESDDDNKKIQLKINESSNRLFYMKQNMLQSVIETFQNIESESPEIQSQFTQIKNTYDQIRGVTSVPSQNPHQVAYDRRAVEPSTISDAIVNLITGTPSSGKAAKNSMGIYIVLAIVIFLFVISSVVKMFGGESNSKVQSEIGLTQIKPIKNKKFDQQINITVRKRDWQKLSEEQKRVIKIEILAYLKKDGTVNYCVLYDKEGNILEVMYEGMPNS